MMWLRTFGRISPPFRVFSMTICTAFSSNWFQPFTWTSTAALDTHIFDTTGGSASSDRNLLLEHFSTWEHVAVTWRAEDGFLATYVNGQQVRNVTGIQTGYSVEAGASSGYYVYLGLGVYAYSEYSTNAVDSFRGSMDNVGVWTRPLDWWEIAQDYATAGFTPPTAPVVKYTFDEGTGATSTNTGTSASLSAGGSQYQTSRHRYSRTSRRT
eukprot:2588377-Prymnesium_polylepis.1